MRMDPLDKPNSLICFGVALQGVAERVVRRQEVPGVDALGHGLLQPGHRQAARVRDELDGGRRAACSRQLRGEAVGVQEAGGQEHAPHLLRGRRDGEADGTGGPVEHGAHVLPLIPFSDEVDAHVELVPGCRSAGLRSCGRAPCRRDLRPPSARRGARLFRRARHTARSGRTRGRYAGTGRRRRLRPDLARVDGDAEREQGEQEQKSHGCFLFLPNFFSCPTFCQTPVCLRPRLARVRGGRRGSSPPPGRAFAVD